MSDRDLTSAIRNFSAGRVGDLAANLRRHLGPQDLRLLVEDLSPKESLRDIVAYQLRRMGTFNAHVQGSDQFSARGKVVFVDDECLLSTTKFDGSTPIGVLLDPGVNFISSTRYAPSTVLGIPGIEEILKAEERASESEIEVELDSPDVRHPSLDDAPSAFDADSMKDLW